MGFLYDFAPNNIVNENTEIPKPSQVWFIGGLLYEEDRLLESNFGSQALKQREGIFSSITRHLQSVRLPV